MKIRNGFVSNSSSSSFVVILPKNFNVEKYVNENISKMGSWTKGDILENFEYDGDNEDDFLKEKVIGYINHFIKNGEVYEDCYGDEMPGAMRVISDVLKEYVVASIDVSSDSGCGVLINAEKVEKILNS